MNSVCQNLQEQISELLRPHRVCLVTPVDLNHCTQKLTSRFLVLSLWRCFLVSYSQLLKLENTFSYLEICSISVHSLSQIVLETDRHTLSFSVLRVEDLEAIVCHMTTSLKRIFPNSSPGKLLKTVPSDLQERLLTLMIVIEEDMHSQLACCGGFSDTYAALCDFYEIPFRKEIQWDVDNIYYIHNCRRFNLQDFSHLDSRDLALAVSALSFNEWFTNIYSKDLKLSVDIQQHLTFLLSRSPSLQELSLEASGLKLDFAIKMAAALREHYSSTLQSINLSGNPIEDKGIIALSQEFKSLGEGLKHLSLSRVSMTARGLGCLSQVLSSNQFFSTSLTHLDLSSNSDCLVTEEATFLFKFLSSTNSLSHLDLSDTNCPLDTLFVSLAAGCCFKLMHLNLARNPFSHRKVREVTGSIQQFFSQSRELKYVGLSATKLPPQALRLLLQGLATNTHLFGLELDLSSCELRSAGAQVIQEHISEAKAIRSLDISDNSFENDMVTLVLSVGRCQSLQHLALGRNFPMKSRALTDILHRIAQLIQDEECPLQTLSLCDSKLKTGVYILLSALGGNAALAELDISGNNIGDTGAKMLAKSLMRNTSLRVLTWDRNNVTARGFQDVADALERNLTLQQMSLPLCDITHSYRNNPDRTKEALHKIQQCLHRNSLMQSGHVGLQQVSRNQQSEKLIQGMCGKLEESIQRLNNTEELQADILMAHEVLQNAKEAFKLSPSLQETGRNDASDVDLVNSILSDTATALTNRFSGNMQELAQELLRHAEAFCPRVVQRSSVCESLSEYVSKRTRQINIFLRSTLVESTGHIITNRLRELRQTLSVTLAESIAEQVVQDLKMAQTKMDSHINDRSCNTQRINIPELILPGLNSDFPTDDYSPAFWRNSVHTTTLRPAPSIKSLLDEDWEQQQTWNRQAERERGGGAGEEDRGRGRCGFPGLPTATPLSLTTISPSHSPSTSPSPPGQKGRRQREQEVVATDAAEAVSEAREALYISPPSLPSLYSIPARPPKEKAASYRALHRREAPIPCCGPSAACLPGSGSPASPMEPLPTQGQTLKHYTASRPRPRRTYTQPPTSRPQDPVSKIENEDSEAMGRVDEGVEEFFTKKIIPDYALKGRWEESNPAQATPSASTLCSSLSDITTSSTTTTVTFPSIASTDTLLTSADIPPLLTSSSPPISSSVTFTPNTTTTTTTTLPTKNVKKKFGDFFAFKRTRAGRPAKAGGGEGGGEMMKVKRTSIADLIRPLREAKEREREKEREKGRGGKSVENVNISNDATTTEGIVTTSHHLAGIIKEKMAPAKTLTTTTLSSETTAINPTITTSPNLDTSAISNLEEEAVSIKPPHTPRSMVISPITEQLGQTPYGERRLKATERSLREGKSQSLILLTGLESEDKDNSKKHASESTSSFEQRLQVMLHRMGVAKTPPADTKMSQSKDEELRKASSEGTILDKPEPLPKNVTPMSASSASPRHPVRPDPLLHPKPTLPERPIGPLPPKPAIAAKPPLHITGEDVFPSTGPLFGSSTDQMGTHTNDGRPGETPVQNGRQVVAPNLCPRKELLPTLSPWRGPTTQDRAEKAQSVTEESLPKPHQQMKPISQRRAVSVHEDTLTITQELKAVLQKSPICFRGNKGDLPPCTEGSFTGEEAQTAQGDRGVPASGKEKETVEAPDSGCLPSSTQAQQEAASSERHPALPHIQEKSPVILTPQKKSHNTAFPQPEEKLSASSQEKTHSTIPVASESSETPPVSPVSDTTKSPSTADLRKSTQETGKVVSGQHAADQRTEPPL